MATGTVVRILVGRLRDKLAEVIASGTRTVTVRGSFGTASYLISEVEVI